MLCNKIKTTKLNREFRGWLLTRKWMVKSTLCGLAFYVIFVSSLLIHFHTWKFSRDLLKWLLKWKLAHSEITNGAIFEAWEKMDITLWWQQKTWVRTYYIYNLFRPWSYFPSIVFLGWTRVWCVCVCFSHKSIIKIECQMLCLTPPSFLIVVCIKPKTP